MIKFDISSLILKLKAAQYEKNNALIIITNADHSIGDNQLYH
jgi:hypothetical protein